MARRLALFLCLAVMGFATPDRAAALSTWDCRIEESSPELMTQFTLSYFEPGRPIYRPNFTVFGPAFGAHWHPPMKLGAAYRPPDSIRFAISAPRTPRPGSATILIAGEEEMRLRVRAPLGRGFEQGQALWLTVRGEDRTDQLLEAGEFEVLLRDRSGRVHHVQTVRLPVTARELRSIYDRKTAGMIELGRDPARFCELNRDDETY